MSIVEHKTAKRRPYSRVEHLLQSIRLGRFAWGDRVAMFSGYFDESGNESDPLLTVAGCVASVNQWVHFEREWKEALAPFGTTIFHAYDFDKCKKPFDKLTKKQADDLFCLLVGIIRRRIEISISRTIHMDQYHVVNKKYVFAEVYGFPYPTAARACMAVALEWARKRDIPRDEIVCFFENGATHKGQLKWIAQRDNLTEPELLGKSTSPLQAADLVAWCHNLYFTKGRTIPDRYDQALQRLAGHFHDWGDFDLRDPDRVPTLFKIPVRDPQYRYSYMVVREHGGRRRPVVRYWPKDCRAPRITDQHDLLLPEISILKPEDVIEAQKRYDASHEK